MRREQRDGQLKCWTEKTNRYSPHWSMRSWWKVCIPWELKSERRHNMIAGTFRTKHVIKVVSLGLWLQSGSTLLSKIHTMKCWKAKQLDWSVQSVKEKQTNKVQVSLELTLIVSSSVELLNKWKASVLKEQVKESCVILLHATHLLLFIPTFMLSSYTL